MTIPDYIAIGVLIVLAVWAVANWVPQGKVIASRGGDYAQGR
jgi:hypothetical protein